MTLISKRDKPSPRSTVPSRRYPRPIRRATLRCRAPRRAEPPVEGLALRGHLDEEPRGRKAQPVFLGQRLTQRDEFLRPHHVNIGERAARERREAEPEDRANIGLAYVGEDVLLEAA